MRRGGALSPADSHAWACATENGTANCASCPATPAVTDNQHAMTGDPYLPQRYCDPKLSIVIHFLRVFLHACVRHEDHRPSKCMYVYITTMHQSAAELSLTPSTRAESHRELGRSSTLRHFTFGVTSLLIVGHHWVMNMPPSARHPTLRSAVPAQRHRHRWYSARTGALPLGGPLHWPQPRDRRLHQPADVRRRRHRPRATSDGHVAAGRL